MSNLRNALGLLATESPHSLRIELATNRYADRVDLILKATAELDKLERDAKPMICGHHVNSVVSSDEGTSYCSECERIGSLERELKSYKDREAEENLQE